MSKSTQGGGLTPPQPQKHRKPTEAQRRILEMMTDGFVIFHAVRPDVYNPTQQTTVEGATLRRTSDSQRLNINTFHALLNRGWIEVVRDWHEAWPPIRWTTYRLSDAGCDAQQTGGAS